MSSSSPPPAVVHEDRDPGRQARVPVSEPPDELRRARLRLEPLGGGRRVGEEPLHGATAPALREADHPRLEDSYPSPWSTARTTTAVIGVVVSPTEEFRLAVRRNDTRGSSCRRLPMAMALAMLASQENARIPVAMVVAAAALLELSMMDSFLMWNKRGSGA